MPYTASADASPTGSPRSLRCRRPAGSGHRADAGELAALAFELPSGPVGAPAPVPAPAPAPVPQHPAVAVPQQSGPRGAAARPVPVPRPRPTAE
ncbi:hypothetical protein Ae406Ps2_4500 [Pseudonocardia sp. Ae406_Ps2]|uniref:hypothetical protein n=1 Tax=unclassified Pseudonocardia TaxID=2619320 RepID=UPI00094AB9DF|nr:MULTISPECIES: hypothetical protein [unclassified Pseudonocardia]OLL97788.1 hypothetical protein Ae331Ps2_1455c [Pseudonocardia sp. Ae331_Ps2]OLM04500.1 hypothetical protein Ae406Ps2_4500 [Pseudonocardia sp. Ae406_Ps2]OLM10666.1 hypothetical protein Ae505Ps2_0789c [Pseudonocardia sp. Ae505_Ps2]OLM26063.1 hypothetical protein Ae706Ps2_4496 [Pseudonocardia sp. Ae706_Ps2]OLM33813.1 hypothetical protein Ae717Ps2_4709c [Pseudonocardia sp. Ae717_Ps2]